MNSLTIPCSNPDELISGFGAGARIKVQSSATQAGTYADVTTIPLVSLQTSYTYEHVPGISSTWYRVRFEDSTGANANDYGAPRQFGDTTDAYVSLDLFRTYVRNTALTDAIDQDTAIEQLALEAGARAIDRACRRTFQLASVASARYFTPRPLPASSSYSGPFTYSRYVVDIDDVQDITGMVVNYDTTGNGDYTGTTTAWRATPLNAPSKGMPYRGLLFNLGEFLITYMEGLQITCRWGWTAYPSTIVNANLIQSARFLKRRDSPLGVAGSPDAGGEFRLLARLDPDVETMVGAYKIWEVG